MKSKRFYLYSLFLLIITTGISLFFLGKQQLTKSEIDEQTENYIISRMGACNNASDTSSCLKAAADEFLSLFPLSQVMDIFKQNEQTNELITSCHETSHYLGQKAYQKKGNIADVFSECSNSCLGGCFHGAVEGYFIKKNISLSGENEQQIKNEVSKICGKEEDYEKPQSFTECFHGLGHALMFLADNDLIKALRFCDVLDQLDHRELCYTGSFMANVDGAGSIDHPSTYYKADDPMYVCSVIDQRYLRMCYTYAVTQAFQADIETTIRLCAQIPIEYREECYRTFGRDRVVGSTTDVSDMKGQCDQIPNSDYRFSCYQGLSWSLMIRYGLSSTLPADFCHIVDAKYKSGCYAQVFNASKKWTRDESKRKEACKNVQEKAYKDKCLANI